MNILSDNFTHQCTVNLEDMKLITSYSGNNLPLSIIVHLNLTETPRNEITGLHLLTTRTKIKIETLTLNLSREKAKFDFRFK